MTRFAAITLAAMLGAATPAMAAHHEAAEAQTPAVAAVDPALLAILADARRDDDRARDTYRHPAETLTFLGVKPGMTVVDYMPSGGWYTRILANYLGADGAYQGMNPDAAKAPEFLRERLAGLAETLPEQAADWVGKGAAPITGFNADAVPEGLNGTVDRAVIFREIHNMSRFGWLHSDLGAIRAMLKDDGMLGIVQHRAKVDAPAAYSDGNKGYLREKDVIALIEAHGFELAGRSEINANSLDTTDYPRGVWTLPPSLATKEDEARYRTIGESDRMTLLFRKRP